MESRVVNLPNILNTPYVITVQTLNSQDFYFEYRYNIRDERVYLSIYILVNNEVRYFVKNCRLVNGINISKNIQDTEYWSGDLFFLSNDLDINTDYTIDNFNNDFYIYYRVGSPNLVYA